MALRPRILPLFAALLLSACAPGAATDSPRPSTAASPSPAVGEVTPTPGGEQAYPLTLTDDAGRVVEIAARPEAIVSLAPSNTEIACALGACGSIVGVNDFRQGLPDEVLASIEDVPDVASFTGVDREAVVALDPDLVLAAGNELTSTADIEALDELGLSVLVLYPESLDEVYADIGLVGTAIDAGPEAEALVEHMRARVADVREAVAGLDAPRTFYEVGLFEGAIYTAGQDSFLASLIEIAGGEPITGDPVTTAIQLEDLVAADPQVILLGDAAYDATITAAAVEARPGWGEMSAVVDGRVVPMPEDVLVTRPGPRIVEGLAALVRAIHPGAID